MSPRETGQKLVAQNKKARHDYSIEETVEAGLVLTGTEVKSLRQGRCSLVDAYAVVQDGEATSWAPTSRSTPRGPGTTTRPGAAASCSCTHGDRQPRRQAHRESGLALEPLSLYFKDGRAKGRDRRRRGPQGPRQAPAMAERDARRRCAYAMGRASRAALSA
jgi:SsrA-binding protein